MKVEFHPDAWTELRQLRRLSVPEHNAVLNAVRTLEAYGPTLGHPHTSQVHGTKLRELRPRRGHSPWRAFYARVGDVLRIGAIGPEAEHDPRGFRAATGRAIARLGIQ